MLSQRGLARCSGCGMPSCSSSSAEVAHISQHAPCARVFAKKPQKPIEASYKNYIHP